MREYLFVDLDLPSGIRRYWSGDIAETFVSALPAAGEYEYTPNRLYRGTPVSGGA